MNLFRDVRTFQIGRGILVLLITTCTALTTLADTTPQDFPNVLQFELGASEFLPGDSITIQEVRGTSDVIQTGATYSVTGTYTLASHDEADLCFYATTSDPTPTPVDPAQRVHVTKGKGSFRLVKKMNEEGYLHLTFYSRKTGQGFGGVYFGQGKGVLRDKQFRYNETASRPTKAASAESVSTSGPNQALFEYLGNPVPPPTDMDAAYTKDGLTEAMQGAAQKAGIELAKLEIDDSEFPFLIFVTFAKEGDKAKWKEQLRANAAYTTDAGGVGGEMNYATTIVPYRAFPKDAGQRIYHRMLLREAVLYEKMTGSR